GRGICEDCARGESHGALGVTANLVVGGEAAFEEEEVGVEFFGAGEGEKADLEAGLERHRKEAQCGFLAGGVTVEEAFDLRMIPSEENELRFGDRSALG